MKRKVFAMLGIILSFTMIFSLTGFAINNIPVKNITLNTTGQMLVAGKTMTIVAAISPANASNKVLRWSSSDNTVAKVNAKGVVTAVRPGTATITVKTSDGKVSARCKIVVSKKSVTIEFATFNSWGDELNTRTNYKGVFADYEKLTGNKVKMALYPDAQWLELLRTRLATGDVPDLFGANCGEIYVPFTDLEPLSGPWIDAMYPTLAQTVTRSSDKKVVQAYYDVNVCLCLIYNKDVFAKAKVNVPLMNWQQFLAACAAIKKTGVTPVLLNNAVNWFAQMYPAIGATYLFKDRSIVDKIEKNQVKPQDIPEFVEMGERFLSLIKKGYVNSDYMTSGNSDDLVRGKYGMWAMGTWQYSDYKARFPELADHLGAMPFTFGDDYISVVTSFSGAAFGVPKASKNKEASKLLINYVLQPEVFNKLHMNDSGILAFKRGYGYKINSNPFQDEINKYLDDGMPLTNSYMLNWFDSSFDFTGDGEIWCQAVAGKDLKEAMNMWYIKYSQTNKAKGNPNF